MKKSFDIFEFKSCLALYPYVQRIATFRKISRDDPRSLHTRLVINFKARGARKYQIYQEIQSVASHLGCQQAIAVPPSSPFALSQLQQLLGTHIERIVQVKKRSHNHSRPLPAAYRRSYRINWDQIDAKQLLVVDDLMTSGTTLTHFSEIFAENGIAALPLAIGVSEKAGATPFSGNPIPLLPYSEPPESPETQTLTLLFETANDILPTRRLKSEFRRQAARLNPEKAMELLQSMLNEYRDGY